LRNREYSSPREICDNPDFDEDLSLYEMLDTTIRNQPELQV